jgi:hypothetical protein
MQRNMAAKQPFMNYLMCSIGDSRRLLFSKVPRNIRKQFEGSKVENSVNLKMRGVCAIMVLVSRTKRCNSKIAVS